MLHLRARWYDVGTGTFLSRDRVESEPPYQYVRGNPINWIDPSGKQGDPTDPNRSECYQPVAPGDIRPIGCTLPPKCYEPLAERDIPPLGCPSPPLMSSPGGLLEVGGAIANSYFTQEIDGFVIGGSSALNHLAALSIPNPPYIGYLNGTCLRATGGTLGFEIVYDFKHQERGLFEYHGGVLNFLGLGSIGGTGYMGLTRGFANQSSPLDPTGYGNGVGAYGGYFANIDASYNPVEIPTPYVVSFSGGITTIQAAPLNDARNINSAGVFATYFGLNGGLGVTIPKGSGDIAVTNYTLLFGGNWPGRVRYALPFGTSGLSDKEIIERQKSIPRRMAAAAMMANEINLMGGSVANPTVNIAVGKIWNWAWRP